MRIRTRTALPASLLCPIRKHTLLLITHACGRAQSASVVSNPNKIRFYRPLITRSSSGQLPTPSRKQNATKCCKRYTAKSLASRVQGALPETKKHHLIHGHNRVFIMYSICNVHIEECLKSIQRTNAVQQACMCTQHPVCAGCLT